MEAKTEKLLFIHIKICNSNLSSYSYSSLYLLNKSVALTFTVTLPFGFVLCCNFLSSLSLEKRNICTLKLLSSQSTYPNCLVTNKMVSSMAVFVHINAQIMISNQSDTLWWSQFESTFKIFITEVWCNWKHQQNRHLVPCRISINQVYSIYSDSYRM